MNKKILALALTVVMLCAAAGVGTMAYFTSQTTSADNVFQAGTLTLGGVIDGQDVENQFATVSFSNMEPGEPPLKVAETTLKNVGSLPFYIYRLTGSGVVDNNPENDVDDTILDDVLMVKVTIGGEVVYNGRLSQMVESNGGYFDPIYGIEPDDEKEMVIEGYLDPHAGNQYQGLSMQCDLTVYAAQNNMPIPGQEGTNPANLGSTSLFNSAAQNVLFNSEEWIKFDWDWIQNSTWYSSNKDELRLRIKHEAGTHDAEVYEIQVSGSNDVTTNGLLDQNEVMVGGVWSSAHDEIWVKRSAFPAEWDTMAVEIGGKLQGTDLVTIPYQPWDLR